MIMNEEDIPLYEVEELSLEDAILLLASDQEKYQTDYSATSERIHPNACWPGLVVRPTSAFFNTLE